MFKQILVNYDNTVIGTVQECAEAIGTNPTYLYKCIKETNTEPDDYYRKPKSKGRTSKLYNIERLKAIYTEWVNSRGGNDEYVASYDKSLYCTLDDYVKVNTAFTKSKLYLIVQAAELAVKMKCRPSNRGRGSNVYLISEIDEVIEEYNNREPMYPTSYDSSIHMTTDDVVAAFPEEKGIGKAHMTGFFAVFGIEPVSKYRREGAKGRPSNLYDRDQVMGAIRKTQE